MSDAKARRFGTALGRYGDWVLGILVLGLLVVMVTPMPGPILDLLLALNMTTAVLLLMVTMNAKNAVELSTFPSILLFSTLFRLGLNVASTRSILSEGKAGHVIEAFGSYVAGDNLAVGLVVFLILVIIQFVVITKGSGRISEVAARFVLDAMPGKQMAIDADLNAGLIDSDEAKRRRKNVAGEAEFYGAMDGASKFVRGDAIAGLIITALNLIGGVTIATIGGMSLSEAGTTYSMLTIGDGLVSQIPALFISVAAGVLVTKDNSERSLGPSLLGQVSARPRATAIAAGAMFAIGFLPGMPTLPFWALAIALLVVFQSTRHLASAEEEEEARAAGRSTAPGAADAGAEPAKSEEDAVGDLLKVDRVCLEIGYRLIPLVQDSSGSSLLDHVAQLRRRFAMREGVVLPPSASRTTSNCRRTPIRCASAARKWRAPA
ncbi:MAG: flagellar biosynthesis protein FlhA [Planctomycetota bacterium]